MKNLIVTVTTKLAIALGLVEVKKAKVKNCESRCTRQR